MKKLLPIILVIVILSVTAYLLLFDTNSESENKNIEYIKISEFNKNPSCARLPIFLYKSKITRPVIDLSQTKYRGIAFHYGRDFIKVLHKKEWERFDALGTYTITPRGDIYLTPNPFISIKPTTFNLQKAIYKIDSNSGNLERWMVIDEVKPSANNPYGLISIEYDCKDNTLWVSAIDKSDYRGSKGRIYHIKPKDKKILDKIDNFDALTIKLLQTKSQRLLLAGSAIDNSLYAFKFNGDKISKKPIKLLTLPQPNLHIRKIKIIGKNMLILEAIKFKYSLVAESNKKQRYIYIAKYNPIDGKWIVEEKK